MPYQDRAQLHLQYYYNRAKRNTLVACTYLLAKSLCDHVETRDWISIPPAVKGSEYCLGPKLHYGETITATLQNFKKLRQKSAYQQHKQCQSPNPIQQTHLPLLFFICLA
ncbi:hypothetical protein GBA52_008636 [Prunus armeniaca]|nr:hypothetical protein GBA52_008636 [Prunus armeniaca]